MAYNLLKGKKGIIFGALDEKSIAWITALKCHEEGADIILTNAPVAMRMGEIKKLAEQIKAPVIPCDVTNAEDINNLIDKSMEH
ncbi:MAG: SDR family oxidoreductase, partial [Bacteroidetes bacterium]|nr:SDR family oxidoreductase [Bacteroidota bacterium]